MKKTFLILPLLVLTLSIVGCNSDDNNNEAEEVNKFIGTWTTDYNGKNNSTIIFNEDGTIGLYFPLEGYFYSFPAKDTIRFNLSQRSIKCYYVFHSENKFTIYNFINQEITQNVKYITFSRK